MTSLLFHMSSSKRVQKMMRSRMSYTSPSVHCLRSDFPLISTRRSHKPVQKKLIHICPYDNSTQHVNQEARGVESISEAFPHSVSGILRRWFPLGFETQQSYSSASLCSPSCSPVRIDEFRCSLSSSLLRSLQ